MRQRHIQEMPKALAKPDGYKTLVKRVTREFAELEVFVKNRVAKGHWNVGKYIDEHLLEHKDKPDYATGFYDKLAEDVGRDPTALSRAVRFYRAYPILAAPQELAWEHYKSLITIKDEKERKKLEERIIRHGWNTKQFRKYLSVKHGLEGPVKSGRPVARLKFTRGKLHAYRIVPANKSQFNKGPLALDLGFHIQYDIPEDAPRLKEDDTVELVLRDGGLIGVERAEVPKDGLFTYQAAVERIIDGDTLWVSFDFHCPVSVSQKLRLRGIDCPELDTEEGKKTKRSVEARLKGCAFIIVKTYKDTADRYDRYLADVFYKAGASDPASVAGEGNYLNQELLDEHLAVPYE